MLSAGLRYEAQTHLGDNINLSPRASFTWSPFKSGSTTFRVGGGIFYDWYETGLYEQTLRVDGVHQQDMIIRTRPTRTSTLTGGSGVDAVGDAASRPTW